MTWDVAVVGAGPAGSATALLLAREGYEVALLDRASFPRPKPCGDCLSPGALPLLRRLGVSDGVEGARPARLRGWRIAGPSGRDVRIGFPAAEGAAGEGLAIPRYQLDAILVHAAVQAGANLLPGHHVVGLERGRTHCLEARGPEGRGRRLRARVLVAADGLRSSLASRLELARGPGPLRKLSLTAHATGIDGHLHSGELHVGRGICAGLAPVTRPEPGRSPEDIVWNVTLVTSATSSAREVRRDVEGFFWRELRTLPGLRARLERAELLPQGGRRLLASGPFHRPTRDLVADGAALVGDAAGYYDPFTGEGIYHGLLGAERLAPVVAAALRAGDVSARRLLGYARPHRRCLAEAHLLQRLVEAVISRPELCDAVIDRLRGCPRFARRLLAVTGDLRQARSLLSPGPLLAFMFSSAEPSTP